MLVQAWVITEPSLECIFLNSDRLARGSLKLASALGRSPFKRRRRKVKTENWEEEGEHQRRHEKKGEEKWVKPG